METPLANECQLKTHSCSKNAICSNSMGSHTCSCLEGFLGNESLCEDIDECQTSANNSSLGAVCKNTLGSYSCTYPFVEFGGDGFSCLDVEECTSGIISCRDNQVCQNSIGSFHCPCREGLKKKWNIMSGCR